MMRDVSTPIKATHAITIRTAVPIVVDIQPAFVPGSDGRVWLAVSAIAASRFFLTLNPSRNWF
jgi:hypothetical protein